MRLELKRQLSAWLLLSVFVPMTALSALHVHGFTATDDKLDCDACVHHIPHGGHLSNNVVDLGECVLCQLLATSFLASSFDQPSYLVSLNCALLPSLTALLAVRPCSVQSSRAPPF